MGGERLNPNSPDLVSDGNKAHEYHIGDTYQWGPHPATEEENERPRNWHGGTFWITNIRRCQSRDELIFDRLTLQCAVLGCGVEKVVYVKRP